MTLKAKYHLWRLKRKIKKDSKKPKRCIDPCMKYCQECKWGYCIYPEDTTREDLAQGGVTFESGCSLGLEDTEPTKREQRKFDREMRKWEKRQQKLQEAVARNAANTDDFWPF